MLREQLVEVYLREADAWLAVGDYEQALVALREGVETTGAERLSDREQDVRERVKLVKEVWYGQGDDLLSSTKGYKYDASGNLIESYDYGSGNDSYFSYEYDASGNLIKEVEYYAGSLAEWYEYEYDASGNRIKYFRYDSDGILEWRSEYEYDASGNQIKTSSYNSDGSLYGWYEYEYDASGNQIKKSYYYSDGSLSSWSEYEYAYIGE